MPFLTPKLEFACVPSPAPGADAVHMTFDEWNKTASPLMEPGEQLATCNASTYTPDVSVEITNESCSNGWVYNKTWFPETLVTEFDLVCGHSELITLQESIFMLGIFTGVLVSGMLSDRFGRRYTIMGFAVGVLVFGVAASYAQTFTAFLVFRFLIAFCNISVFTTTYVYCLEMVGGRWSTYIGIGLEFPWAVGYSVLPAVAYIVRDWSWLQFTITVPLALFVLITFILPESPRWLLAQGRLEEAEDVLDRAMEINGKGGFPPEIKLIPTAEKKKANLLHLYITPNLRKKTLIQYFNWFTCSFIYYAFTLDQGDLIPGGNIYINNMVQGLSEFPAYALTIVILLFFGRRLPLAGMFFAAAFFIFLSIFVSSGTPGLIVSVLGKFFVTGAFAVIYLYAAELFPTMLRQTGLGSSSMWARVGSILSSPVGRELGKYGRTWPLLIFAFFAAVGGFLTLLLPETYGHVLPESVEEGEEGKFYSQITRAKGNRREGEKEKFTMTISSQKCSNL